MKVSEWNFLNAAIKMIETVIIAAMILNNAGSIIWILVICGIKISMAILDTFAADSAEEMEKEKAHNFRN